MSRAGRNENAYRFHSECPSQVPRERRCLRYPFHPGAYACFYPKARVEWMMTLGNEMGGPEKARAMVKGQGISLILKSLSIKFKRPVTYPDTVSNLTAPRFFCQRLTHCSRFSFSLHTNHTFPRRCLTHGFISTVGRRCTRTRSKRLWWNLIVSWCGMIMEIWGSATLDLRRGMWF